MFLHGIKKKKKRLGRGNSSGIGNTCCRGNKGQKSRSGYSKKFLFSGGQTKISIVSPKIGFKKKKKKKITYVNIKNFFFIDKKKINVNIIKNFNNFFLNNNMINNFKKRKIFFSGGNLK